MRVVDVHTEGDGALDAVLHPRLTVLTGLQAECQELAQALAQAFVLAGNGLTGTVEYSGFHMPLDQTTVVSLDLQGEGFRVVTAGELPEPDHATTEDAAGDLEERRAGWKRRLDAASQQVGSLMPRVEATRAAVEVGRAELDAEGVARAELLQQSEQAANHPAELARKVEAVQAELSAADAHVALLTQLAPVVAAAFHADSEVMRRVRIGTEPAELRDLLGRAAASGLLSEGRVAELTDWLDSVAAGTARPNEALAEMLSEVDQLERRWAEVSAVGVEDEPPVVQARERLDVLTVRLSALEELAGSGILADRARSEIDAAHNERARIEGERHLRSGGLEEAVEAEQRVLSTYGFDSYLDYTIALSTRSVGDAVESTLQRVRTEQVGSADALEAARGAAAADRTALTDQRKALRERIQQNSGVDADSLTVDLLATVPALPGSLHLLGDEVQAGMNAHVQHRGELVAYLESIEAEQQSGVDRPAALAARAEEHASRAAALAPLVDRAAQEHESAAVELVEAQRIVDEANERLAAIERQFASLALPDGDGYSAADVAAIVTGLTPTLDPHGSDPVPVLMVDTFSPLGSLATQALEATLVAAVRVQLVYITDDEAVIDWAERLSPSAGQLVRLGKPNWFQRRLARRAQRREHSQT